MIQMNSYCNAVETKKFGCAVNNKRSNQINMKMKSLESVCVCVVK